MIGNVEISFALTRQSVFGIHRCIMDTNTTAKTNQSRSMNIISALFVATCCIGLIAAFVCPSPVHAHPHAFIVQRITVMFDDKGMTGLRVKWKFDEMFSSLVAEEHDKNQNGILEADELLKIKKNAFEPIAQQNYFTFIKIDDQPFDVRFITDFNAVLENHRLTYEFSVPCHVAASTQFKKITIGCYDPSYYTAVFFARDNPVTLIGDDAFEVKTAIREDPDAAIYFNLIHPWVLFLSFRADR